MKALIIFTSDGSEREDDILAPFRSVGFTDGLHSSGVDPVPVSIIADNRSAGRTGNDSLLKFIVDERPDVIQTFGPEHRLATVWRLAAGAGRPIAHCVSCWRRDHLQGLSLGRFLVPVSRIRRASRHVTALIGTSRSAVGERIAGGLFTGAAFSVILPPPVECAPVTSLQPLRGPPVFGVYDPLASGELIALVLRAVDLSGRRSTMEMRIATKGPVGEADPTAFVGSAGGVERFLSTIDVLVVPDYNDSCMYAIVAALRAGKSVIVPDGSAAAELIGYGRSGLMFQAGSPYELANALNLIDQSRSQAPVLIADGGHAVARTDPAAVARGFAKVYGELVSVSAQTSGAARRSSNG
jgi:glycosyltransferase involved in cell wall biosynthesis